MKLNNFITFSLLCLAFWSCGDDKKKLDASFSLTNSDNKSQLTLNDSYIFEIKNANNIKIDSAVFYLNQKKIKPTKRDHTWELNLSEMKLGKKILRALIYAQNTYVEKETQFEIVSHVEPKLYNYEIVNTYPHDIEAYTQGLEFYKDTLYESTGNGEGMGTGKKGKSSVRKVDFKTGKSYQKVELEDQYFGEGLTVFEHRLYQLTWRNRKGFVYNPHNLKQLSSFVYSKNIEGWGLCNDGTYLYQTDGTHQMYKIDPKSMEITETIEVYSISGRVNALNELEYIDGKIWGNVYQKDAIAIINPNNGIIEGLINLSKLKTLVTQHPDLDVLNGIAYHPERKTIFVTGKNWDKLFEIKILESSETAP